MTISVTVDAVELPDTVQQGASTAIDDPVDVLPGWSGIEQRNRKNTRRPRLFQIGFGVDDLSDRQAIIDLYMTNGQLVGFLFHDWTDDTLTDQNIDLVNGVSISDGSNRTFLLKKTYANSVSRKYIRRITRPVASGLTVKVDGSVETHWTLQPLGTILFDSGHAPAAGKAVTVSGSFIVPVRFASKLTTRIDSAFLVSVPTAQLMELFEAPEIG
jgi:uncharacterized protein (TIGR02217 family)